MITVWALGLIGVPYLFSICETHSSYVDRDAGLVLPMGAVPQTRIPLRVPFYRGALRFGDLTRDPTLENYPFLALALNAHEVALDIYMLPGLARAQKFRAE